MRFEFVSRTLLGVKASYGSQTYKQWDSDDTDRYGADISLSKWLGKNYFRISYLYMLGANKKGDSTYISYYITNNIGTVVQYNYYNNDTNYTPSIYDKELIT